MFFPRVSAHGSVSPYVVATSEFLHEIDRAKTNIFLDGSNTFT